MKNARSKTSQREQSVRKSKTKIINPKDAEELSFSRDAISVSGKSPSKQTSGLGFNLKRPSRTKSFINRGAEQSPGMKKVLERTKTLNVSVRSRSSSVLSGQDIEKVQRIQSILQSMRSKDEVPWPAAISGSAPRIQESNLRIAESNEDLQSDENPHQKPLDVSKIEEELSEDLGGTSKGDSPLIFRQTKEGEILKKSIGQLSLQIIKEVKNELTAQSVKSSLKSQQQEQLQEFMRKSLDRAIAGKEMSNPMLFLDGKRAKKELTEAGLKSIDLAEQDKHLIQHLINNKQFKVAKKLGVKLSQLLSSGEYRDIMKQSGMASTPDSNNTEIEPGKAKLAATTSVIKSTGTVDKNLVTTFERNSQSALLDSSLVKNDPQLAALRTSAEIKQFLKQSKASLKKDTTSTRSKDAAGVANRRSLDQKELEKKRTESDVSPILPQKQLSPKKKDSSFRRSQKKQIEASPAQIEENLGVGAASGSLTGSLASPTLRSPQAKDTILDRILKNSQEIKGKNSQDEFFRTGDKAQNARLSRTLQNSQERPPLDRYVRSSLKKSQASYINRRSVERNPVNDDDHNYAVKVPQQNAQQLLEFEEAHEVKQTQMETAGQESALKRSGSKQFETQDQYKLNTDGTKSGNLNLACLVQNYETDLNASKEEEQPYGANGPLPIIVSNSPQEQIRHKHDSMTFDPQKEAPNLTDSIAVNQLQMVRSPSHGSLEQHAPEGTEVVKVIKPQLEKIIERSNSKVSKIGSNGAYSRKQPDGPMINVDDQQSNRQSAAVRNSMMNRQQNSLDEIRRFDAQIDQHEVSPPVGNGKAADLNVVPQGNNVPAQRTENLRYSRQQPSPQQWESKLYHSRQGRDMIRPPQQQEKAGTILFSQVSASQASQGVRRDDQVRRSENVGQQNELVRLMDEEEDKRASPQRHSMVAPPAPALDSKKATTEDIQIVVADNRLKAQFNEALPMGSVELDNSQRKQFRNQESVGVHLLRSNSDDGPRADLIAADRRFESEQRSKPVSVKSQRAYQGGHDEQEEQLAAQGPRESPRQARLNQDLKPSPLSKRQSTMQAASQRKPQRQQQSSRVDRHKVAATAAPQASTDRNHLKNTNARQTAKKGGKAGAQPRQPAGAAAPTLGRKKASLASQSSQAYLTHAKAPRARSNQPAKKLSSFQEDYARFKASARRHIQLADFIKFEGGMSSQSSHKMQPKTMAKAMAPRLDTIREDTEALQASRMNASSDPNSRKRETENDDLETIQQSQRSQIRQSLLKEILRPDPNHVAQSQVEPSYYNQPSDITSSIQHMSYHQDMNGRPSILDHLENKAGQTYKVDSSMGGISKDFVVEPAQPLNEDLISDHEEDIPYISKEEINKLRQSKDVSPDLMQQLADSILRMKRAKEASDLALQKLAERQANQDQRKRQAEMLQRQELYSYFAAQQQQPLSSLAESEPAGIRPAGLTNSLEGTIIDAINENRSMAGVKAPTIDGETPPVTDVFQSWTGSGQGQPKSVVPIVVESVQQPKVRPLEETVENTFCASPLQAQSSTELMQSMTINLEPQGPKQMMLYRPQFDQALQQLEDETLLSKKESSVEEELKKMEEPRKEKITMTTPDYVVAAPPPIPNFEIKNAKIRYPSPTKKPAAKKVALRSTVQEQIFTGEKLTKVVKIQATVRMHQQRKKYEVDRKNLTTILNKRQKTVRFAQSLVNFDRAYDRKLKALFMSELRAVAGNDKLRAQVRGLMKEKQKGIYEEVKSRDSARLRYEAAMDGRSIETPLQQNKRSKVAQELRKTVPVYDSITDSETVKNVRVCVAQDHIGQSLVQKSIDNGVRESIPLYKQAQLQKDPSLIGLHQRPRREAPKIVKPPAEPVAIALQSRMSSSSLDATVGPAKSAIPNKEFAGGKRHMSPVDIEEDFQVEVVKPSPKEIRAQKRFEQLKIEHDKGEERLSDTKQGSQAAFMRAQRQDAESDMTSVKLGSLNTTRLDEGFARTAQAGFGQGKTNSSASLAEALGFKLKPKVQAAKERVTSAAIVRKDDMGDDVEVSEEDALAANSAQKKGTQQTLRRAEKTTKVETTIKSAKQSSVKKQPNETGFPVPDLVKEMFDSGAAVPEDPVGEDANDARESMVGGLLPDAMMQTQSNMKFLSQFSLSQSSMKDALGEPGGRVSNVLSPERTSDHMNEDLNQLYSAGKHYQETYMSGTHRSQLDRGAITIKDGDTFLSMPPGHASSNVLHYGPDSQLSPHLSPRQQHGFDNDFFMQPQYGLGMNTGFGPDSDRLQHFQVSLSPDPMNAPRGIPTLKNTMPQQQIPKLALLKQQARIEAASPFRTIGAMSPEDSPQRNNFQAAASAQAFFNLQKGGGPTSARGYDTFVSGSNSATSQNLHRLMAMQTVTPLYPQNSMMNGQQRDLHLRERERVAMEAYQRDLMQAQRQLDLENKNRTKNHAVITENTEDEMITPAARKKSRRKKKKESVRASNKSKKLRERLSDQYDPNSDDDVTGAKFTLPTLKGSLRSKNNRNFMSLQPSNYRPPTLPPAARNYGQARSPAPQPVSSKYPFPMPPAINNLPNLSKKTQNYMTRLNDSAQVYRSTNPSPSDSPPARSASKQHADYMQQGPNPQLRQSVNVSDAVKMSANERSRLTQARIQADFIQQFAAQNQKLTPIAMTTGKKQHDPMSKRANLRRSINQSVDVQPSILPSVHREHVRHYSNQYHQ